MASSLRPAFAYTIVYVKDVAKSVDFYGRAFGCSVRRLDESRRWAELESGQTTIAFTPAHQHETDQITGAVQLPPPSAPVRAPLELCFDYSDVDAAFKGNWMMMMNLMMVVMSRERWRMGRWR
ncbi:uncharacterized protein LOC131149552 isoform X2 [Malania oleifera]|uniref:uncharacterized protein LOC131149552 isoform X2 n=1 Tax=Malania oleifera TaxID=397392 RepID=UPI0025ADFFF2|nr:uncharacterized protein LOC131149552 isoform X2 [Malania oleifera]